MRKQVAAVLALWLVTGCAAKQVITPIATGPGFYHRVVRGETLWGISRSYDIPVDRLVKTNRLPEASRIDTGQLIFIPKDKAEIRPAQTLSTHQAFAWPVDGRVISTYGSKHKGITNKGIHIAAEQGTDVVAAGDGRVSYAGNYIRGFGHMIIINHADTFQTIYAHNSENLVKPGDEVKQSETIAHVGSSGRATQPYLHFEIRKNHKPRNPFHYLP